MSATATVSLSNAAALHPRFACRNGVYSFRTAIFVPTCRYSYPYSSSSSSSLKPSSLASQFPPRFFSNGNFPFTVPRRFSTLMEWQECKVKMEVEVPVSVAYNLYSDRKSIPRWMTFISSVEVLKEKTNLSRWTLKYNAFGQDIEYTWLARNLQPIPNQKIHWISLEGLPNRGIVRFFPKGPSSCDVELTFAYEVPPLLVPFASALQPLMQGLIRRSLEQFAEIAKSTMAA